MESNKVLNRKLLSCVVMIIVTLLTLMQISLVSADPLPVNANAELQEQSENFHPQNKETKKNPHGSLREFEQYLQGKYKKISRAVSDVKQTLYGPSGNLFISGNIAPQRKPVIDLTVEPDRHVRSRAIAKAFMDDEPVLLGISKSEELREINIQTSQGYNGDYTDIHYKRYINEIELDNNDLLITVGPSENITGVQATIIPVLPEVYEATTKKTLSEKEITSIIDSDITEQVKRSLDMNNVNKSFKKVASTKYPYVFWKVSYVYEYIIDAFSGNILTKECGIIPPFNILQQPAMENPPTVQP